MSAKPSSPGRRNEPALDLRISFDRIKRNVEGFAMELALPDRGRPALDNGNGCLQFV